MFAKGRLDNYTAVGEGFFYPPAKGRPLAPGGAICIAGGVTQNFRNKWELGDD